MALLGHGEPPAAPAAASERAQAAGSVAGRHC